MSWATPVGLHRVAVQVGAPPTLLDGRGRAVATIVDDDDHGKVLGRLTDLNGSGEEYVVWDVVAGTTTSLAPRGGFTAIDEHAVYGGLFRQDLTTGVVTSLPSVGPGSAVVDVDGRGRILVKTREAVCEGCPEISQTFGLIDGATLESVVVRSTGGYNSAWYGATGGAIGNGGHVALDVPIGGRGDPDVRAEIVLISA